MAEIGKAITINMALGKIKTLRERHAELCGLRNQNARRIERYGFGKDGEREVTIPEFDFKMLDKKISTIAREIRILDEQIKVSNAETLVKDYLWDDDVLSEIL
jgi:hypothetical protein